MAFFWYFYWIISAAATSASNFLPNATLWPRNCLLFFLPFPRQCSAPSLLSWLNYSLLKGPETFLLPLLPAAGWGCGFWWCVTPAATAAWCAIRYLCSFVFFSLASTITNSLSCSAAQSNFASVARGWLAGLFRLFFRRARPAFDTVHAPGSCARVIVRVRFKAFNACAPPVRWRPGKVCWRFIWRRVK